MKLRAIALASVIAGVALAAQGHAAVAPQIIDPKGDALGSQATYDVVSTTYSTVGTGKGRTYKPTKLIVTLELAAPASTQAGSTYSVNATVAGCGYFNLSYTPGATLGEGSLFTECGSPEDETGSTSTLIPLAPKAAGNTITWNIGIKALPKPIKPGSMFSDLVAFTAFNEPVFGIIGPGILGSDLGTPVTGNFDDAAGTKSWKLG